MDGLDYLRDHLLYIWQGQSAMDDITPNTLWQFTPPPDDLIRQDIAPNPTAAETPLANWRDGRDARTASLHQAVLGALDLVHRQFAYKTSELESQFLDHYAFFCINRPNQPFPVTLMQCLFWLLGAKSFLSGALSRSRRIVFRD